MVPTTLVLLKMAQLMSVHWKKWPAALFRTAASFAAAKGATFAACRDAGCPHFDPHSDKLGGSQPRLRPALTTPGALPRIPAPLKRSVPNGDFVANTPSAEKAARQAEKHRAQNIALRSRMRSAIRGVTDAIASGKKDEAQKNYIAAVPVIDSLVNKQIVHRNKAARHKSRLAARIRGMSS